MSHVLLLVFPDDLYVLIAPRLLISEVQPLSGCDRVTEADADVAQTGVILTEPPSPRQWKQ
jgi:hypothetical protein